MLLAGIYLFDISFCFLLLLRSFFLITLLYQVLGRTLIKLCINLVAHCLECQLDLLKNRGVQVEGILGFRLFRRVNHLNKFLLEELRVWQLARFHCFENIASCKTTFGVKVVDAGVYAAFLFESSLLHLFFNMTEKYMIDSFLVAHRLEYLNEQGGICPLKFSFIVKDVKVCSDYSLLITSFVCRLDYCLVKELGTLKQIPSLGHLEEGLELVIVFGCYDLVHKSLHHLEMWVDEQLSVIANQWVS